MKMFLAGTYSRDFLEKEIDKADYILESFFYFKEWQVPLIKTCKMFLLDSGAFTFMNSDKGLMFRCVLSTLFGEGLDALVFITIAFAGVMPIEALATMIIAQATFKTVYEIVCFPITKAVITKTKSLVD